MTTPIPPAASAGVRMIALERSRQIAEEGYAPEHDVGKSAQLLAAGSEYARVAALQVELGPAYTPPVDPPFGWPWEAGYWKPADTPARNAEKAGALLAAALDALLAEQSTTTHHAENGTR